MPKTLTLIAALCFVCSSLACGPKCPEVKATLSKEALGNEDITRINEMVKRRKDVMAQAEKGGLDYFAMERAKFSVTAYEIGIAIQARIINLAQTSSLYAAKLDEINEARCLLDRVLEPKKTKPDDVTVADADGRAIQQKDKMFQGLFGNDGKPRKSDLETYFASGIGLQNP